jgi:hypothetical protein
VKCQEHNGKAWVPGSQSGSFSKNTLRFMFCIVMPFLSRKRYCIINFPYTSNMCYQEAVKKESF